MHKKEIITMKPKLGLMVKKQRDFFIINFFPKKDFKDFLRLLGLKMTALPLDI